MNRIKIKVYDALNHTRLLGYLNERPVSNLRGSYASVITAPVLVTAMYCVNNDFAPVNLTTERIDFHIYYEMSDDGYTLDAVFRTDAKLETLMNYRLFSLPGETREATKRRLYMRAYGG